MSTRAAFVFKSGCKGKNFKAQLPNFSGSFFLFSFPRPKPRKEPMAKRRKMIDYSSVLLSDTNCWEAHRVFGLPPNKKAQWQGCVMCDVEKAKAPSSFLTRGLPLKRRLPTLPLLRSTIGVTGLNFSVRNGKRWNPGAVVTWIRQTWCEKSKSFISGWTYIPPYEAGQEVNGQLVMLGYDIAAFTPASYQRRSLRRPWEI